MLLYESKKKIVFLYVIIYGESYQLCLRDDNKMHVVALMATATSVIILDVPLLQVLDTQQYVKYVIFIIFNQFCQFKSSFTLKQIKPISLIGLSEP